MSLYLIAGPVGAVSVQKGAAVVLVSLFSANLLGDILSKNKNDLQPF